MRNMVRRIFVEKKPGLNGDAEVLYLDLRDILGISGLNSVRVVNRYDISGINDDEYAMARNTIFSEATVDLVYDEILPSTKDDYIFSVEYLPGQYDQRADSAAQCIQIVTQGEKPIVRYAKTIIINGNISNEEFERIKEFCINPVDSRKAPEIKPYDLDYNADEPLDVQNIDKFINMQDSQLESFLIEKGLAMSFEDLKFTQEYFKNVELRNPTLTEIRVIDTYWSDHCRHTTFQTTIQDVLFNEGKYLKPVKKAYEEYLASRDYIYKNNKKDMCLMDIATIAMKELKINGALGDLDESEEINACSIQVDVDVDGTHEKWLVMFKNETHNHPTEIEPFGGAATCLGGAIRDPLSGRSYVYQAMRITGSGDPRQTIQDTLHGKLPQRTITLGAAHGYSSYGNQIGLATGFVDEVYDDGFIAKRMEIGAVIGAVPKKYVVREAPVSGDVVVLVGGRTGRDGCGGATGSSKKHTEKSLENCGAEVQKGNAPTERKLQRFFRDCEVTSMIKRCNDFGAGGIAVAVGELTDGLLINLDLVPKKYEGLDGTELAISESQERMAVVVSKNNLQKFINMAAVENLEATYIADVNETGRLKMTWRGKTIVDIKRDFLDTNGVRQKTSVVVEAPDDKHCYFRENEINDLKSEWMSNLSKLSICSKKGLVERFDSTVGAGTVLMPFGGKYQFTPAEGMAAKIPVLNGETKTGTIMTYGYNPKIARWSPFHGAVYAVVESVAKIAAMGGDYKKVRLTLQEYFEKLGRDPKRWGKPLSALLGALYVEKKLNIPAIGGKDSMSGTFNDIDVPPTLVSFAVNVVNTDNVISPEFKFPGDDVVLLRTDRDDEDIINLDYLKINMEKLRQLIESKKVISAFAIRDGGVCEAVSKMSFGNKIGIKINENVSLNKLFYPDYGSFLLEFAGGMDYKGELEGLSFEYIGKTQIDAVIDIKDSAISIDDALEAWEKPLEDIFKTKIDQGCLEIKDIKTYVNNTKSPLIKTAKPRVLIPVFPGSNCEYDSKLAFERAGGNVKTLVFRNITPMDVKNSIEKIHEEISKSQIVMLPGGFSAGDEPEGSGKFIAAVFRNPMLMDAVAELLEKRDGLMLGICNGFQALIKLGLVPYGRIQDINESDATLTYNRIGRHISQMVMTRVVSTKSPWLSNVKPGEVYTIPVSHGEGRFTAPKAIIEELINNNQIATQYVDFDGRPSSSIEFNPNGSEYAIEGITSPDGRVFGRMGHSERISINTFKNVPGNKNEGIFEAGINYFK